MTPRFAPLCWGEEHYRAQRRLAQNRGYEASYMDSLYRIRSLIQDFAARTIISN